MPNFICLYDLKYFKDDFFAVIAFTIDMNATEIHCKTDLTYQHNRF